MPTAHAAPESSRKRHLALASLGVVSAIGILAARQAFEPLCYWSGRLSSQTTEPTGAMVSASGRLQSHALTPAAYLSDNAPSFWIYGLTVAWLITWSLTVFVTRRDAPLWLRLGVAVPFLATAWTTSRMTYACNPF